MSITFTKLFSSITESTIWCETSEIRIVWITMLAMADKRGRIWASIPGLANRAQISIEETETALEKFLSPDSYSRTSDHEGRRIEPIDGGWRLLNHEKYRAMRDAEERKAYKKEWIADKRKKEKVDNVDRGRPQYTQAEAYTEAEADTKPKEKEGKKTPSTKKNGKTLPKDWELPEEWRVWTEKNCPLVDPKTTAEEFKDWALGNSNRSVARKADWFASWRNWCRRDNEKYEGQEKWQKRK